MRKTFKLKGLCFSPYIDVDPNVHPELSLTRIERMLDIILPFTKSIRLYNCAQGLENVPAIAKRKNLSVAGACWIDGQYYDYKELDTLKNLCKKKLLDLAIVGTNVLSCDRLNEDKLIRFIKEVKKTGVKTTTSDKWEALLAHPNVMAVCDVIMAEFFPYLAGIPVEKSISYIENNYKLLKDAAGGKEVIVGETGWLSQGKTIGKAVPSLANEIAYLREFVKWAEGNNIMYYYFLAFDEPWKAKYKDQHGVYWGIFDQNCQLKKGMQKVFQELSEIR